LDATGASRRGECSAPRLSRPHRRLGALMTARNLPGRHRSAGAGDAVGAARRPGFPNYPGGPGFCGD
jgi:hypothetical protein